MNYTKKILLLYFTLLGLTSKGQIVGPNLVQNPSFEEYYQCPYGSSQLNFSKYWWGGSTEYYNVCATNIALSCPSNYTGFQYPYYGNAYAGFVIYWHTANVAPNETYAETIKTQLQDSLIKDKRYCINYYVSLSEYTFKYANVLNSIIIYDSIGAMFSTNQVQDDVSMILCDTCAKFAKSIVLLDTLNWMRISGSVLAKGGEKYLTIGKFNTMNWLPNISCEFYVFVDDVSVCECAYNINLGMDTRLCEGESLLLNATLPNTTYLWQDGSTNATYEAKQSGTYWVRAYVAEYDITTSDTIIISAEEENVCNTPLIIPNFITPNNDNINDNFQIGNADKYDISLQIYNRWGTLIYQTAHYTNDYNCHGCADGVYYYLLTAKSLRSGKVKDYKGSLTVMH